MGHGAYMFVLKTSNCYRSIAKQFLVLRHSCYTASSPSNSEVLKWLNRPLKLLYSKVHPDRFATEPVVATKNQKALQSLNELLDILNKENGEDNFLSSQKSSTPSLRTIYLEFFVPAELSEQTFSEEEQCRTDSKEKQPNLNNLETTSKLRRVSVPFVYDSKGDDKVRLMGSLLNLFRSCNIEAPGELNQLVKTDRMILNNIATSNGLTFDQLLKRDVVGKAYELRILTKRHAAKTILKDRVAYECKVRSMSLTRAFGIQVQINEDLSPSMAIEGLKRLAFCIETSVVPQEVSIKGGIIRLNGGAKLEQDSSGVLHLGMCSHESCWQDMLTNEQFLASCLQRNRLKEECLEVECLLANALGVRLVCGDSVLEEKPVEYIQKLKSLYEEIVNKNLPPVGGATSHSALKTRVSVIFREKKATWEENLEWGVLSVPQDASLHEMMAYIEKHGPVVAHHVRKREREQAQVEAVRKSLRLERLRRDETVVSMLQWSNCCKRLVASSMKLRSVLQGLSVVVSDHFKVAENGEVYIPYYFECQGTTEDKSFHR